MKLIFISFLLCVASFAVSAKEEPKEKNYQALFLANFINGWCIAKLNSGTTIVSADGRTSTTPSVMSDDEKKHCRYVKAGLANKCFENSTCPPFDKWVGTESKY